MVWSIVNISDLMARAVHRVLTGYASDHIKRGGNNWEIDTAHALYAMVPKDAPTMRRGKRPSVLTWGKDAAKATAAGTKPYPNSRARIKHGGHVAGD